jgi:hypothetical protein
LIELSLKSLRQKRIGNLANVNYNCPAKLNYSVQKLMAVTK